MAKIISMKCQACGANLVREENQEYRFCQYCGSEIFIGTDYSSSHTYRKIDEGRIKEAEILEKIRLKELELAEREIAGKEKAKRLRIKASIVLGVIGLIACILGTIFIYTGGETIESIGGIICTLGIFSLCSVVCIWTAAIDNNKK